MHRLDHFLIVKTALALICAALLLLSAWMLAPLYLMQEINSQLMMWGIVALLSGSAWLAASFSIRRGYVEEGAYAFAWGVYSIIGLLFWMAIAFLYPLLIFWEPPMCPAWQGPESPCDVGMYLETVMFFGLFDYLFLFLPHAALCAFVFIIRSFLSDYRRVLSS